EKDPVKPQVAIIEHTDVRRMLLAQKAYAEGAMALVMYSAMLVDEHNTAPEPQARQRAGMLLDFLTPITKSWPSQWCLEANSLAIQVHGGYGYTREYNVEQFYRDNRLNAIHEGTHGIHGLDLLGRKVSIQNGALFKAISEEVGASIAKVRAAGVSAELHSSADALAATWERIGRVTAALYGAGDMNKTLANASLYLEAVGHTVVAWMWLEQALVAATALANATSDDQPFYLGKLQAYRYFFHWELPKVQQQLDLLASIDTTTLDMQDAWF
ncbi:MAG: acyl-CoA dehydrogenase C-terminal domain-containing protein, partial [Telluria sp.]